MGRVRSIALAALGGVLAAACTISLFMPPPTDAGKTGERYLCVWEDGSTTMESYSSAFALLDGVAENGAIELKRGDHVGEIAPTESFLACNEVLGKGSLLELTLLGKRAPLLLEEKALTRIGKAALFREYGSTVYYSFDEFHFTGTQFVRGTAPSTERAVLLSGTFEKGYLASCGATSLRLAGEAEFTADRLLGSAVSSFEGEAPYIPSGDALLLESGGQMRLIAAVPTTRTLALPYSDYTDEGALICCTALEELTLPYVGSGARREGEAFDGSFARLFSDGKNYFVPDSLKRVKVLGGALEAHCFYACPDLEEVDACGLDPDGISKDAFADMVGWKTVHSPYPYLNLTGKYTKRTAACGCTVFTRL